MKSAVNDTDRNFDSTAGNPAPELATVVAVRICDVALTYAAHHGQPARQALEGISLDIALGQSVALLGPNGSGKSSLLRIISAILRPDSGTVEVFGSRSPSEIRRRIGVVFQANGLDPHLTVEENLRCQASLYGIPRAEAKRIIRAELKQGGLYDRRASLVKTLSLGLARRVDLVRALLHRPRLLLLDEPTTGLDPLARASFLDGLELRRREHGLSSLMSTHIIDEADRCERVVFIHEGRIVADGTPNELRRQMGSLVATIHVDDPALLDQLGNAWEWRRQPVGWWTRVGEDRPAAAKLAGALSALGVSFTMAPPTLADVFAHVTGASLADTDVGRDRDHPTPEPEDQ